jgi:hypothetical protein
MDINHSSKGKLDISKKLKSAKKLIKYIEGYSDTPEQHQKRIANNIENLKNNLGVTDLEGAYIIKTELESALESLKIKEIKITTLDYLQGWYLRPLINHFDNSQKMQTFLSTQEGTNNLKHKLKFYVPEQYYIDSSKEIIERFQQFFTFKASGKNTIASQEI